LEQHFIKENKDRSIFRKNIGRAILNKDQDALLVVRSISHCGRNLKDFSVKFQGIPIEGDLSAAEFQIWNQGKQPILKSDILKPILLGTLKYDRIYQVSTVSTRDVIGATTGGVGTNSTRHDQGVVLSWNILEQNDGIKVQIIYGGGVNEPLTVDGVIVGQKELTQYQVVNGQVVRNVFATIIYTMIIPIALAMLLILMWNGVKALVKGDKSDGVAHFGSSVLLILIIVMLVPLVNRLILTPPKPPFGF
jgi:hypothetical protein